MGEAFIPKNRRGTALLVISVVVAASTFTFIVFPGTFPIHELSVRVAIIDSGMDATPQLEGRILASHSFIDYEHGYSENITETQDSRPKGNIHGTAVASIIAENAPNAGFVNAKVVDENDYATQIALIQAIHWVVENESCDIINLSIGGTIPNNDLLQETISWAFEKGVSIIAAAGNGGLNGIKGTSVEAPAVFNEVIAVGAIDDQGQIFSFSGRGPLADRSIKPDIVAVGYYKDLSQTLYGTSFSTPYVAAAATELIRKCQENNWDWTPGMIKAVLLSTASFVGSESWEVGAGRVDVENALRYLDIIEKKNSLPMVVWVIPNLGKYSFERWFVNTTVDLVVSIFASTNGTFNIFTDGSASPFLTIPETLEINQTGQLKLKLRVESSVDLLGIQARIIFDSPNYKRVWTQFKFDCTLPLTRVAFDLTHTSWHIDSIYGQFRAIYTKLTQLGISVEQLVDRDDITIEKLNDFDLVMILDPCSWNFNLDEGYAKPVSSISYSKEELLVYQQYWKDGGNVFIAAGDNSSMDVESINSLISRFEINLEYDRIPPFSFTVNGIQSTEEIVNINTTHPVMSRIESFDYNGCSLNSTNGGDILAWGNVRYLDQDNNVITILKPVIISREHTLSGRVIVSGSNFFLDNYALNGYYHSSENSKLVLQIVVWLLSRT